jgi:hypothetical protein
MRRILLLSMVLGCSFLVTGRAECKGGGGGGGSSTTGTFQAIGGSGISGKLSMSGGASGTTFVVSLGGLTPDAAYIASWSTTVACDMGTAPPAGAFWNFHASKKGTASFSSSRPEAFSNIHSVAIQLDTNGHGLILVACAPVN